MFTLQAPATLPRTRAGKICIYGAGAIGCYLGGRLQIDGHPVCGIGRPRMAAELRRHGLRRSVAGRRAPGAVEHSQWGTRSWALAAEAIDCTERPARAADAALLLVTVKSADTAAAAAEPAPLLRPGTVVVSFQNDLNNADILRATLPQCTVLAGMVPFNVVALGGDGNGRRDGGPTDKPNGGHFHQAASGHWCVRDSPALTPWLPAFAGVGLALRRYSDMQPVLWGKLLFNLNNAINALENLPLQAELAQRGYRRALALTQQETLRLLRQADIRLIAPTALPAAWLPCLPDALLRQLGHSLLKIDPLARSSMSDDLAAGRRTEVDWINGAVPQLAARLGRPAPVNARLCELVHAAARETPRPSGSASALLDTLQAAARNA